MLQAPPRYQQKSANADRVYDALCKTISDRVAQVEWDTFTTAEWDQFPKMAQLEGVGPYIYWIFKENNWPINIPKRTAASLMDQYHTTQKHNTQLYKELDILLEAFEENKIPTILLKGAYLARTVYPNPSSRPMGDIDILVNRENLDKAIGLIQHLGYIENSPELRPGLREITRAFEHAIEFRKDNVTKVELHWNLAAGDSDWWKAPDLWAWSHTIPLPPQDNNVPQGLTLDLPSSILYLCVHSALQHGLAQTRLIWLYDLHLLIQNNEDRIDWNNLIEMSVELEWSYAVWAVLDSARSLFSTQIPGTFLEKIQRYGDKDAMLVRTKSTQRPVSDHVLTIISSLTTFHKAKLIFAYIFPSRKYILWRYQPKPRWMWLLHYPIRWWRMAVDTSHYLRNHPPGVID